MLGVPTARFDSPSSADLVGEYYNPELDVIYHVEPHDGEVALGPLRLRHPRGSIEMKRTVPDSFPLRSVRFDRDENGRATGFVLDGERARQLRFERLELRRQK